MTADIAVLNPYIRAHNLEEAIAMTDQSEMDNDLCPKPHVQNEETLAAIMELEAGMGTRFATVDALMASLADDNEA